MKRTLTAFAALSLVSACHAAPLAPLTASVPVLRGHVDFPGYAVQATSSNIAMKATVSLIDSSGVARMGGTTDSFGNFTLYQSTIPFAPQPGQVYTLNVTRRYTNGALMTLKTVVKCQTGSWDSITGTTVSVNVTTTGVVNFDDKNADVGPADLIGKVDMSIPANPVISAIGTHGAVEISDYVTDVNTALSNDADPSGPLTYHGSATLTDQASIDAIARYTVIDGNLVINLDSSFTSFSLPNLKKVTGYLSTYSDGSANQNLTSLSGLSNLTYVGSNCELDVLPNVTSLQALSKLTTVGGNLDIQNNGALTSLAGLENITKTGLTVEGGNFIVSNNALLASLTTFKLTSVKGYMTISSNPKLANLDGLASITSVSSSVRIESNDVLSSVSGLNSLTSAQDIYIDGNPTLVMDCMGTLPGLPLQYSSLYISNNSPASPNCTTF